MPLRTCAVSFRDSRGSRHTVEVTAETLYEAAALGLSELKRAGFLESTPALGTRLDIEIKQPSVRHTVTVQQVSKWLEEWGTNPSEIVKKERLKKLLR